MVERAIDALKAKGRVVLEIEKRVPGQGEVVRRSGKAVAALRGLEMALKKQLTASERLRIAAEVGSDVPLFLVAGTVLGVGRGEDVYPLPDLPAFSIVVATPDMGVSTPKAFADWDALLASGEQAELRSASTGGDARRSIEFPKLTGVQPFDRMDAFSRKISSWLGSVPLKGGRFSGVPAGGRGRAEILLLDLVRTGIENDCAQVVVPQ